MLVSAALAAWAGPSLRGAPFRPAQGRSEYPAVLMPRHTALIRARRNDQVASVRAEIGARVRRGQLLVQLRNERERAVVERASALLERAQSELRRAQQLHDRENISNAQFEGAQADARLAQADYDLARVQLADQGIAAPFEGLLADVFVSEGASVRENDPLVRVTSTTPLWVEAILPEKLLARLRKLHRIEVRLTSPESTLWLPLRGYPPVVDPASGTFTLRLELSNALGRLVPGTGCRVFLPGAAGTPP